MKRFLLFVFLLTLTLAVQATVVTFRAPEGCALSDVYVDENYVEGIYDEATQLLQFSADLEPGEHKVTATLTFMGSGQHTSVGKAQAFTVGNSPSEVIYSLDNFALLKFLVKDELGKAFPDVSIRVSNELGNSEYCSTNDEGEAEMYVASDFGQNCTYTVSAQRYAELSGTFAFADATANALSISYEKYRRLTVSVKGLAADVSSCSVGVISWDSELEGKYIKLDESIYPEEPEVYFVVPDGAYCCHIAASSYSGETNSKASAFVLQNVDGASAAVEVDMSKCQPITVTNQGEKVTFNVNPVFNGKINPNVNDYDVSLLYPGDYQLYAMIYDDAFGHANAYYNSAFSITDAPVSLSVSTADFHHVNFVLNGDYEDLGHTTYISYKGGATGSAGYISSDSENSNFYSGDYEYSISVLWLNSYSYAFPYMNKGSFSVKDADVTVPVDLTGVRLFKAGLNGIKTLNNVVFTNENGEQAKLSFMMSSMGLALPVGKYTVEGDDNGKQMSCNLEISENSPEWISLELKETQVGIGSVIAPDGLSAQMEEGGLRIVAPDYSVVKVELFDMSGRRVGMVGSANDGEVISTSSLTAGVYMARLSAGSAVRTVKFVVH